MLKDIKEVWLNLNKMSDYLNEMDDVLFDAKIEADEITENENNETENETD